MIVVRMIKRGFLCGAATVLSVVCSAGSAFALSPWWHLTSHVKPTILQPGQAKDDVQQLTVSATEGSFFLIEQAKFKVRSFAYNATAEEVEASLQELYGVGDVTVAGGPGNEAGSSPYVITFTGGLADRPVPPMLAFGGGLEGGRKEAVVSQLAEGRPDGYVVVRAANLGDANAQGSSIPVSIAEKLPKGLRAVNIEGVAGESVGSDQAKASGVECSLASVSCVFAGTLGVYDSIEVTIAVAVEHAVSGELGEASVSGGGAPSVSIERPIQVGSSQTPFGVQTYEMDAEEDGGAADTQAGSHPFQLTTTLQLSETVAGQPAALVKDLHFNVPPGLIGNPTPFPQCKLADFFKGPGGCPPQTIVGVARTNIGNTPIVGNNQVVTVPLVNLEPSAGEPARFGFDALVPVFFDTYVRTGGDYGVTVSINNITQAVAFLGSEVTFWGVPGDPRHNSARNYSCLQESREGANGSNKCEPFEERETPPLLAMPTSCTGPLQTTVDADSWNDEDAFQSFGPSEALPGLDGCNRLQFSPSVSVAPDGQAGSTPTGLAASVHVPQSVSLDPEGLAEADVKDTTVALPQGVVLNPAAADGLESCSEAQIALDDAGESSCPEASKVGTVEIHTPLLPNNLTGAAYLAAQEANPFGSLVALYVLAEDPVSGVRVKLAGEVVADPVTGQLVATFKNTPQLPFEDFRLHFFGGDRAPLATPASCGSYTTVASIAPWSGTSPVGSSSTFNVDTGPNGSACANPLPFGPSLAAGTTSIQAGGFSPFTMTMSREDGSQDLQAIRLKMPPGLSGLLSSVKLCGEPQADQGLCGPESEIGETTVSVGVGGDPYSVKGGKVFVTGPYDGAPYGLSIVNPAKAGPYDLEKGTPCDCVVVRAKIEVDPLTAALTITSDNSGPYKIPTILDGIPLQIKHVNVTINRPGFTFNPTNCNPMSITGSLSSTEGATSALSVPLQVTNCAVLGFKPAFSVSTSGKTSRADGASLHVKLVYPKAPFGSQANISKVKVDLPKQLPSRLTTLQKACTDTTFDQNPALCAPESRIGTARATTPLLPVSLTGPVYFVSHAGLKFPELVIVLSGYGTTIDLYAETFINKAGVTSSTFRTVPDAPVGTFELTLPEGKYSALAAPGGLCKTALKMPTAFTAQNGATIKQTTPISVIGCPKHEAKKAKRATKHNKKK